MPKRTFFTVETGTPPTDPYQIGWVAGFMDGESCLTHRFGTAVIRISNCHLPTLKTLCEWYGGSVCYARAGSRKLRPAFEWALYGARARDLLVAVAPFMREKRAQAEAILAEPVRRKGYRLTPEDVARRAAISRRLSELKRPRFYPTTG